MDDLILWVKGCFWMLTILTVVAMVVLAKVTEARNILKGKGGAL
jgi:hypothetical protein